MKLIVQSRKKITIFFFVAVLIELASDCTRCKHQHNVVDDMIPRRVLSPKLLSLNYSQRNFHCHPSRTYHIVPTSNHFMNPTQQFSKIFLFSCFCLQYENENSKSNSGSLNSLKNSSAISLNEKVSNKSEPNLGKEKPKVFLLITLVHA